MHFRRNFHEKTEIFHTQFPIIPWRSVEAFSLAFLLVRKRDKWQKPVINKQISVAFLESIDIFHSNNDERKEVKDFTSTFFPFHGNYAIFAVRLQLGAVRAARKIASSNKARKL